jgi:F-type H+-transporting ATPase subunit epsilon
MADRGFRLTVLTEEKSLVDQDVVSVTAPGSEGYLGIWRDHAPLVTALIPGKLTVKPSANHEIGYAISGGFLEVSENRVTVLADAIEKLDEIDLDRAEAAVRRARNQLENLSEDLDRSRAEAALRRAKNRARLARISKR